MENLYNIGRVGVLSGGPSSERDISVKSALAVSKALLHAGIDCLIIDVTSPDLLKQDLKRLKIDSAFIALHGRFGEDGRVQSLLCKEGIPYTGSGPGASRISLDKALSKDVFMINKIPTPGYLVWEKKNFKASSSSRVKIPCVVKPCNEGSSIGMSIVEEFEQLAPAVQQAFLYDDKIIIEDYINGIDITVGILDDKPLPVVSIEPKDKFYSYNAKYTPGKSIYTVPADISKSLSLQAMQIAIKAHKVLGCESFSRVDMMLDKKSNTITVLEINTIPGFTETSLLPKAALAAGIDFSSMCIVMLEYAVNRQVKLRMD